MNDTVDVNLANWEQEVAKATLLTVVYFWHNQCPWCLRLTPIFNEVTKQYKDKVKFVKLNILEDARNQEIASNFGVMSTPTLMFFCNGRPLGQIVGMMSKQDFESLLNNMLNRYKQCIMQSTELRPSYIV